MLYSAADYESVDIQQGDDVQTVFGRGRVLNVIAVKIRQSIETPMTDPLLQTESDKLAVSERQLTKYQVQLTSWRLAGRSTVKCFLFHTPSCPIRVLRKKTLTEMNARERVEFAQRQKSSAIQIFAQKKYQQALNIYAGAVEAVRYVQYDSDSSNECRADLVEVMVTCSNNAATCCVQLQKWSDAQRYAQNALVLLDALYSKRGMKIHAILTKHTPGLCDAKLFGEWRVKSYMIIARALGEKEEYSEALEILKKTRDIITLYTTGDEAERAVDSKVGQDSIVKLKNQEREVARLVSTFLEQKKESLKRERATAQAMFAPHGVEDDKTSPSSNTSGSGTADTTNSTAISDVSPAGNLSATSPNIISPSPCPSPRTSPSPLSALKPSSKSLVSSFNTTNSSNPKPDTKPNHAPKRVSFADKLEDTCILDKAQDDAIDDDDNDDNDEPWYLEHKEALVVLALGALASLSFILMRRK
jgi:tetratricopeptide (TPR) repeat protein